MGGDAVIVAGIGFNSAATAQSLASAMARIAGNGLQVNALASIAAKTETALLRDFAAQINLPLQTVQVAGIVTPSQSPRVLALVGTGSLAEAAALVAAGPNARLISPRTQSECGCATIAIAQSQDML
jgi:cobalt-precorrin 5A hydrolase